MCEGGPYWRTKFTPNLINYRRLWKNVKIDLLVMTCYAPGHSRFNPIEHCWALHSKELTGVTLPISVGDDVPSTWEDNTLLDVSDRPARTPGVVLAVLAVRFLI